MYQNNLERVFWRANAFMTGFLNRSPRPPLGTTEQFPEGHEQRPLLNRSAVILQNPIGKVNMQCDKVNIQCAIIQSCMIAHCIFSLSRCV